MVVYISLMKDTKGHTSSVCHLKRPVVLFETKFKGRAGGGGHALTFFFILLWRCQKMVIDSACYHI